LVIEIGISIFAATSQSPLPQIDEM